MTSAVLDATVLVSAFDFFLAVEILSEMQRVLLKTDRIRRRYTYPDDSVCRFIRGLRSIARLTGPLPSMAGMVGCDPNDDMIVACTLASHTYYTVTRDDDLLSLHAYSNHHDDHSRSLHGHPAPLKPYGRSHQKRGV